jgi:hypothetical protein
MKKYLIYILLISLASASFAQSFSVGTKVGVNIGSPVPFGNIPNGAGGNPIIGRNLGIVIETELNDFYSIQFEISMMRKACNFFTPLDSVEYIDRMQHPAFPDVVFEIETFFNGEAKGAFDNFYIEQSLIHNFRLTEKLDIALGVYSAWLQHSNTTATGIGSVGYDPNIIEETLDYANNMREWDYGFKAGIRYRMLKQIELGLRLSYGLESVFVDSFSLFKHPVNNTFLETTVCYKLFPAGINANIKKSVN